MFLLRLAFKDLMRRPFFVFRSCALMMLGLFCLCLIMIYKSSIENKIELASKELMGSDLQLSARGKISDQVQEQARQFLSTRLVQSAQVVSSLSLITVEKNQNSKLIRTQWMGQGYPFYGQVQTRKKGASSLTFLQSAELICWLDQNLAAELDITIGDRITIGKSTFVVDDLIEEESTLAAGFASFFPVVYLNLDHLKSSQIIQKGSTFFTQWHYQLRADLSSSEVETMAQKMREEISDFSVKIKTPQKDEQQSQQLYITLSDYLGILALLALFLALMGVGYLQQIHLLQNRPFWGLLKVMGFKKGQLLLFFIFQQLILCLLYFLLLVALLSIFFQLPWFEKILVAIGLENLKLSILLWTCLKVSSFSVLATLCSFLPVLSVIIKQQAQELLSQLSLATPINAKGLLLYFPLALLFWAMSFHLTQSYLLSSLFLIFLFLFVALWSAILLGLFWFIQQAFLKSLPLAWPLRRFWGLSLRSIIQRKTLSLTTSSALVFSLILSITLLLVANTFFQLISEEKIFKGPSHFLFSIEEEQLEGLKHLVLNDFQGDVLDLSPLIGAKMLSINGMPIGSEQDLKKKNLTRQQQEKLQFRNRGANFSYRSQLNPYERVIQGEFVNQMSESDKPIPISLEQRYAQRVGVQLGDQILFDLQGLEIKTQVSSIRQVDWLSFYPNFFILFPQGVIDDAPKSYLAAVRIDPKESLAFQTQAVKEFANLGILPLAATIKKVKKILQQMSDVLLMMFILILLLSLILILFLLLDRVDRARDDFHLLHIVGLKQGQIKMGLWWEIFFLALLSFSVALLFSLLFSSLLCEKVLMSPLLIPWGQLLLFALLGFLTLLLSSYLLIHLRLKSVFS